MAIPIETLSGPHLATFQGAMRNAGFMVPLALGTFDDDPYVDLTLPADYAAFWLILVGVDATDNSGIGCAFSPDAGVTFPQDLDNSDSYYNDANPAAMNNVFAFLAYSDVSPYMSQFIIYPGAAGKNARIQGIASIQSGTNFSHRLTSSIFLEATGRQNLMRLISLSALSAADNNGKLLIEGHYYLSGLPIP